MNDPYDARTGDTTTDLSIDLGPAGNDSRTGTAGSGPSTGVERRQDALDRLEQLYRREREQRLNAVDALVGAQAELTQAKADNDDLFYRLHVRETELARVAAQLAEPTVVSEEPTLSVRAAAAALVTAVKVGVSCRLLTPVRRLRSTAREPTRKATSERGHYE